MRRSMLGTAAAMLVCAAAFYLPEPANPAETKPSNKRPAAKSDTFWGTVENFFQVTFRNIGALGEGRTEPGQVMEATLVGNNPAGPPRPISPNSDLTWPVAGPGSAVVALRGRQVVRIEQAGASPVALGAPADWIKLVGVDPGGRVLGFVSAPPFHRAAILEADGKLTLAAAPATREDQQRQSILLQQSRAFADGSRLRVVRSRRGGRGMDVVLERQGATIRVSDCGNADCGQPSLSPDGKRVLFVR